MQEKFEPTIIILSAGNGERMQSSIPKVLHKISSQLIIDYVVKLAISLNSNLNHTHIIVNRELLNNKIFQELNNKYKLHEIVQNERLGTGDAVKTACNNIESLNDLVLILYGDTPFVTKETVLNLHNKIKDGSDLCIIGFNSNNPKGYGRIVSDSENKILEIIEEKEATAIQKNTKLCNSGIILVKKEALCDFLYTADKNNYHLNHEFYLTDIVKYLKQKQKNCTYITAEEDEVIGINNRHQLIYAEKYNQSMIVNKLLNNGVTIINPETSYFANNIDIQNDVTIYPNVFIGNNTFIESNSIVHSFSYIEGADIKNGSIIGPFARIRPNTKIGRNSKIGNFVEVKNSNLMENVKAGHLSYIGDATISDNVNIGAGTVFCNYDGKNKHHTFVGEEVFIGSNSSIISPVKINSKAMIAAGSVITKDVEENALAIARSKQVNLKNKSKIS
jgi:bifunctional UDP-N-acetylglucosamine pyrophosphorylase / glucosamine-1-phosphate N-acetyltransferase